MGILFDDARATLSLAGGGQAGAGAKKTEAAKPKQGKLDEAIAAHRKQLEIKHKANYQKGDDNWAESRQRSSSTGHNTNQTGQYNTRERGSNYNRNEQGLR